MLGPRPQCSTCVGLAFGSRAVPVMLLHPQQREAIARALAMSPKAMLVELTSALDPSCRARCWWSCANVGSRLASMDHGQIEEAVPRIRCTIPADASLPPPSATTSAYSSRGTSPWRLPDALALAGAALCAGGAC